MVTKRILITVKAYPNPSKKYGETVCCAGIDLKTNQWIRLYPIPFRDLDDEKRFKKYSIIEAKCFKAPDDKRRESYKVQHDSISIIDWINPRDKWKKRKEIVLPTLSESMCEVLRQSKEKDISLALIKPSNIDFTFEKVSGRDEKRKSKYYAQLGFFDRKKEKIEHIPFRFYYSFKCKNELQCIGHKLTIIDWEIGQAYRSWRYRYRDEELLLAKIREKWLTSMCSSNKDVYFFVGNMQRFRKNFMVLGVFYPPKI